VIEHERTTRGTSRPMTTVPRSPPTLIVLAMAADPRASIAIMPARSARACRASM